MTSDEIARLRALCAAATPGPWEAVTCRQGKHHIHAPNGPAVDEIATFWGELSADVEFVAEARTALLVALSEVERVEANHKRINEKNVLLQVENERLRGEVVKAQAASFRLCSQEETRLRDMILGLGLDPDAGVAK